MESPRKFNDCYFYYYSTCIKGDKCVFRHEPAALGCETMCPAWQQGQCLDSGCKLRHMELRKNRKQIQCYWESQPGGCRKKHCPFMHKNPDARTDGIAPSQPSPQHPVLSTNVELPQVVGPAGAAPPQPMPLLWQHHQRQVGLGADAGGVAAGRVLAPPPRHEPLPPHLDPLLINFEEGLRRPNPCPARDQQHDIVMQHVKPQTAV